MLFIDGIATHLYRSACDTGCTIFALNHERSRQSGFKTSVPTSPSPSSLEAIGRTQFKIRLASVRGVHRQAGMLIQTRYAQRGYGSQEFAEKANRWTIVAYDGSNPIGTLSIGFDSAAGLLCDDLYSAEIDQLRASGRRVCEFIKLAVEPSTSSISSMKTLAALFHIAFIYAHTICKFDDVVIEVNPSHVNFYQRVLGFKLVGPVRTNLRVNAPANLLQGDFAYMREQLNRYGGNVELRREVKSIYPYGFSAEEEQGILERLDVMSAPRQ
ncbi:MAG: long-chain N-acyl amino acid synthase [Pseudomonadota bacterium]